jgi:DNA helicase-2/ATP-dependent DNA helicase PcrA
LSRDNITSNVLKKEVGLDCPSEDLLQGLLNADSDNERKSVISSCIKALELSADKRYRDSIREISKFLKIENDKTAHKKEALRCLNLMLARYAEIQEMSLMEFHAFLKSNVKDSLAKPSRGRPKEFYDKYKYKELAVCVNIKEDNSLNRTIHKAKGDEFDNVILVLKKASDLAFVLNPDLEGDEEHRINYVAVSRARKKLFISVPSLLELSDADRCRLSVLLDIIE